MNQWMPSDESALVNYLSCNHLGRRNAIRREELSQILHIKPRILKKMTEYLSKVHPILSSNKGLYYSNDPVEIEGEANWLKKMGWATLLHAENLRKLAQKIRLQPQEQLFGNK